ncbi:putative ribonuclease H-like domain-containing protein [Tanacetum coccineum]
MHVAFDKRKVKCFNCHNTGNFARECKFKGSKEGNRQKAGKGQNFKPVQIEKEALMIIDEGQINWVEQTTVRSINHASYCLVITDDCSRFCWVFFLAKKDETSDILKTFVRQIENQLSQKVKIIRSDNGTEFKNRVMLEFCGEKGIKQEFSNARTPQQNGVAERMKHIEIRHHFIRDCYEKKLIQVQKIHTDLNVADLLTKPFDGPRFNFLLVNIGMVLLGVGKMLQAQLGHGKGHASCHLLIGWKLVVSNDVVVNLL